MTPWKYEDVKLSMAIHARKYHLKSNLAFPGLAKDFVNLFS